MSSNVSESSFIGISAFCGGVVRIAGSNPAPRTIFSRKFDISPVPDTVLTQNNPEFSVDDMIKWPKKVKHRNKVLAKIYRPCKGRESYRVTWYTGGKRQMKSFPTYTGKDGAKEFADSKVKELANNSQAATLTSVQATDALAAIERLASFFQSTGRKVSLLSAVSEYCDVTPKLPQGRTLAEAIEGFSNTVATVKRQDLATAVEEFNAAEESRTKSVNGQRAQLDLKYHYNRAIQLRRLASSFKGYAVCDLAKHDLDGFFSSKVLLDFSPKNRNHHRTAFKQFLSWCIRKDYLSLNHRLFEAESMKPEKTNGGELDRRLARGRSH